MACKRRKGLYRERNDLPLVTLPETDALPRRDTKTNHKVTDKAKTRRLTYSLLQT